MCLPFGFCQFFMQRIFLGRGVRLQQPAACLTAANLDNGGHSAAQMLRANWQREANGQPLGGLVISGGLPGMDCKRSLLSLVRPGMEASRPMV